MSADTGVGPAIASGSHTYSGICALLPTHARNRNRQMTVYGGAAPSTATADFSGASSSVLRRGARRDMAIRKPKSPLRFTMNAFLPASAFTFSLNQKPMSKYEQSPTPSHPMNMIG